jgi:hypothetical protein
MYQIIRCLWFHRSHRHHHHRDRVIDISFLLIALKVLWDCCQLLWNIQLFLLFDGSVVLNPRFATRPVYHYHQRGVTLSYKRVSWFPQKTQYKVRLKQPFLVVSSGFSPGAPPKGREEVITWTPAQEEVSFAVGAAAILVTWAFCTTWPCQYMSPEINICHRHKGWFIGFILSLPDSPVRPS